MESCNVIANVHHAVYNKAKKCSFPFSKETLNPLNLAAILPNAIQTSIHPSGQIFLNGAQVQGAKSPRS